MPNKRWGRYAVGLGAAAVVALTSGCSGGDKPGPTTSSTGSTTATSSATTTGAPSSTTTTRTVSVPPEAQKHTEAGAKKFLEFFIDETAEAGYSADSSVLREISGPDCAGCKTFIRLSDELKTKGQHFDRSDSLQLSGAVAIPGESPDRYEFDALIDAPAVNTVDGTGKVVARGGASKFTLRTTIEWSDGSWFVKDARKVVG